MTTHPHTCRPMHIAGRGLVATCTDHWMTQPAGTAAPAPTGGTR